jgi:predicted small secreted protein
MTARNALFVALAVLGLSACNTIGGLGEDVEAGGEPSPTHRTRSSRRSNDSARA